MKTVKFLILLIVLGLLGLLVWQNQEYFLSRHPLIFDLKVSNWGWTIPAFPEIGFWGICFGLGLLISGIKGLTISFSLGREIKKKEAQLASLRQDIAKVKERLDVFIHDPFIKKVVDPETGDLLPEEKAETPDLPTPSAPEADKKPESPEDPAPDNSPKA